MAVTDLDEKARRSSLGRRLSRLIGGCPVESNTALSRFVWVALYFRDSSLFDSLLTGDVMVHDKFTGIHIMDFCPLAGLASISFQLETAFKSSAAEGRKGKDREGREGERDEGGERNVPYNERHWT